MATERLDDTDHAIKGDPHIEGSWDIIRCPYCGQIITDVWDYGLNIYQHDDMDEIDCPECERPVMVVWGDGINDLYTRKKQPGLKNARERFNEMLADHLKQIADHTLEQHVDHEHITAFYLREKPKRRIMSTYIVFTREGIIITGDLCPGGHGGGVTSVAGYNMSWFSGKLSVDYLCEKFPDVKKCTVDHSWLCAIQQTFARLMQNDEECNKSGG